MFLVGCGSFTKMICITVKRFQPHLNDGSHFCVDIHYINLVSHPKRTFLFIYPHQFHKLAHVWYQAVKAGKKNRNFWTSTEKAAKGRRPGCARVDRMESDAGLVIENNPCKCFDVHHSAPECSKCTTFLKKKPYSTCCFCSIQVICKWTYSFFCLDLTLCSDILLTCCTTNFKAAILPEQQLNNCCREKRNRWWMEVHICLILLWKEGTCRVNLFSSFKSIPTLQI